MEAAVLAKRADHPAWGGSKLRLVQSPAPSTITAILRRAGQLAPEPPPRDFLRFEHSAPNELWQLDFMGHRALDADRVHPMTVLDDHSRFALALAACANEQHHTVQDRLTTVFRRFGLPRFLLTDNGAPWAPAGEATGLTRLEAWWLHLGIEPWHGQPSHPQTHGKIERFHGTIAAEVFVRRQFPDLAAAQTAFDAFRAAYNHARPHEALDHAVPADRYQPSPRPFPETLQEIIYAPDDTVRLVNVHGSVSWQGRRAFAAAWSVSRWGSAPPPSMAPGTSLSVTAASPPSTGIGLRRCNLCLRTPVTSLSGLHRHEASRPHPFVRNEILRLRPQNDTFSGRPI